MVSITYACTLILYMGFMGTFKTIFFVRHNSSLVCMVRITCVYIDTVFGFYGYIRIFFFKIPFFTVDI